MYSPGGTWEAEGMAGEKAARTLGDVDPDLASVLGEIKAALRDVIGGDFRLILFGSRARGDHEPDSDVDLMVTIPDELYTAEMRRNIRYAGYGFSHKTDHMFSVMVTSESLVRKYSGFKAFGAVEREGVPV